MIPEGITDSIAAFVDSTYDSNLASLINSGGGTFYVSLAELADHDGRIFEAFINDGRKFLRLLQLVVESIVAEKLRNPNSARCRINCKINELPSCPEICFTKAPRSRDVGKVIQFTGIVVGMNQASVINNQRTYQCSKCKYIFNQEVDILDKSLSCKPSYCPNPDSCNSKNFSDSKTEDVDAAKQRLRNFQEFMVQELAPNSDCHGSGNDDAARAMPSAVTVLLLDDIVDSCKPGDWISVVGLVENRWKSLSHISCLSEVETVIIGSSITVLSSTAEQAKFNLMSDEDFHEGWMPYKLEKNEELIYRDGIVGSICPRLYGLYPIKLAIALMLLSGCSSANGKAVNKRSEIHVLLVGDPGTGKSQILSFAKQVARRSVLTTGVGTSAAGLTVAAVQTSTGWSLEPGALLLADRGLCCIDEFSRMRSHDKTVVHEALEQQTVSVAKAGIVCRLPCRTAVLAATNAVGHNNYDVDLPLTVNTSLGAPLLSRFDLIFILRDCKNDAWDELVADHILTFKANDPDDKIWSIERLRSYFAVASKLNPKLSQSASKLLTQYYVHRRNFDSNDIEAEGRTTTRLLDSLARLAQAHAKLMNHSTTANLVDAVQAVVLMELSRLSSTNATNDTLFKVDNGNAAFMSFPDKPNSFLFNKGLEILETLHLSSELKDQMKRDFGFEEDMLEEDAAGYIVEQNQTHPSENSVRKCDILLGSRLLNADDCGFGSTDVSFSETSFVAERSCSVNAKSDLEHRSLVSPASSIADLSDDFLAPFSMSSSQSSNRPVTSLASQKLVVPPPPKGKFSFKPSQCALSSDSGGENLSRKRYFDQTLPAGSQLIVDSQTSQVKTGNVNSASDIKSMPCGFNTQSTFNESVNSGTNSSVKSQLGGRPKFAFKKPV